MIFHGSGWASFGSCLQSSRPPWPPRHPGVWHQGVQGGTPARCWLPRSVATSSSWNCSETEEAVNLGKGLMTIFFSLSLFLPGNFLVFRSILPRFYVMRTWKWLVGLVGLATGCNCIQQPTTLHPQWNASYRKPQKQGSYDWEDYADSVTNIVFSLSFSPITTERTHQRWCTWKRCWSRTIKII